MHDAEDRGHHHIVVRPVLHQRCKRYVQRELARRGREGHVDEGAEKREQGVLRDRGTEDVFDGADTRAARGTCPQALWTVARRKLDQINRVQELRELAIPPGNRLE